MRFQAVFVGVAGLGETFLEVVRILAGHPVTLVEPVAGVDEFAPFGAEGTEGIAVPFHDGLATGAANDHGFQLPFGSDEVDAGEVYAWDGSLYRGSHGAFAREGLPRIPWLGILNV